MPGPFLSLPILPIHETLATADGGPPAVRTPAIRRPRATSGTLWRGGTIREEPHRTCRDSGRPNLHAFRCLPPPPCTAGRDGA